MTKVGPCLLDAAFEGCHGGDSRGVVEGRSFSFPLVVHFFVAQ